jgi:hypothetical protein
MIYLKKIGGSVGLCHYPDFLTGWFELIEELLEPQGQGKRFSVFFGDFYDGKVSIEKLPILLLELKQIWEELKDIPVDFERIYSDKYFKNVPDLDNQINKKAKSYGEVFLEMYVHENFFYCLILYIEFAIEFKSDIEIQNRIGPNGI